MAKVSKQALADREAYQPVVVARSDGQLETGSGRDREKNEPTPEQLDDTPDKNGVVDYYKKLGDEEPKSLDWKRKLAEMLMRELGDTEHKGRWFIN